MPDHSAAGMRQDVAIESAWRRFERIAIRASVDTSLARSRRVATDEGQIVMSSSRFKRVAFGLVNFRHHRVRCLLYAGKPDWSQFPTIQP